MDSKFKIGAAAGITSGFVMGMVVWVGFQTGLLNYDPFYILARILLGPEMGATSTGTIVAIITHLIFSFIIGVLFAYFVPKNNTILWGLVLGIVLQFFFGALVLPFFNVLTPFWLQESVSMTYTFFQRMVFGGTLGYLYGLWSETLVKD